MKYPLLVLICAIFPSLLSAQYITIDENQTAEQLVRDVLINNPCANVSNISVTTWNFGSGSSFGYFTDGGSSFPFANGIVLTTGRAASAIGPNSSIVSEGPTSWPGDPDLEAALGIGSTSINATVLEFDFLPLSNKISFDYIFSSEQYLSNPSQNQCSYTDGFVFLLKEANGSDPYQNLAVVPGTNIPIRSNTVRGSGTICPPANEAYFDAFNGTQHPTNYNGQTRIMTAQATVTPGTLYHIKLVVADQGNNLYDSAIFLGGGTFKVEKDLGPDRLLAADNPVCFGESLPLDATEPGNNDYQWFRNNQIINGATNAVYNATQPGDYRVEIVLNASACVSSGEITVEYSNELTPSQATIVQCDADNDGNTIFNLTKAISQVTATDQTIVSMNFYENTTDINPIANPTAYTSSTPRTLYALVTNDYGCSRFIEVFLQMANNNPATPDPLLFCDEDGNKDGIRAFDLVAEVTPIVAAGLPPGLDLAYYATENEAIAETNILGSTFTNTVANQQIIWARILNGPDCYGVVPVTLVVNFLEATDFEDEERTLCELQNNIILSVPAIYESYLWNDVDASTTNSLLAENPGVYTVTVTDVNGCSDTKKFIVIPSGPAVIENIVIEDFNGGGNTITILYSGIGDYEFSLDGDTYQDDPYFTNVADGFYTIHIRDINRCGIVSKEIYVLDYPRFFTPNGDGYHDRWFIANLQRQNRNAKVSVFDRYGKLLYSANGDNDGWDGNFNGVSLPASDYWFVIELENKKIIRGHFSLKR